MSKFAGRVNRKDVASFLSNLLCEFLKCLCLCGGPVAQVVDPGLVQVTSGWVAGQHVTHSDQLYI